MKGWVSQALRAVAMRRAAWRRARNFGPGKACLKPAAAPRLPRPTPLHWLAAGGCIAALGGAFVIDSHARQLA